MLCVTVTSVRCVVCVCVCVCACAHMCMCVLDRKVFAKVVAN